MHISGRFTWQTLFFKLLIQKQRLVIYFKIALGISASIVQIQRKMRDNGIIFYSTWIPSHYGFEKSMALIRWWNFLFFFLFSTKCEYVIEIVSIKNDVNLTMMGCNSLQIYTIITHFVCSCWHRLFLFTPCVVFKSQIHFPCLKLAIRRFKGKPIYEKIERICDAFKFFRFKKK